MRPAGAQVAPDPRNVAGLLRGARAARGARAFRTPGWPGGPASFGRIRQSGRAARRSDQALLFEQPDELGRADDLDALDLDQHEQVVVAGDEVVGTRAD